MTAGRSRRGRTPGSDPLRDRVVVAVAALVIGAVVGTRTPGFTTDSESYLDVARSVVAGHGLVQHVADFWRPRLPDPLGLWPPLYPLLVAALARLGAPLEGAARFVSGVAFPLFALAFLALAGELLGAGAAALAVTLIAIATLAVAFAAGMAWSEMPYLALATAALLLLARVEAANRATRDGPPPRLVLLAGLLAGLAALTRYIGVVLIPVGFAWLLFMRVPSRARLVWLLAAAIPPGAWFVHNLVRFHALTGPGLPPAHGSPFAVLAQLLPALRWGFVPWPLEASAWVSALFVVLLFALGAFAWATGGARALVAAYAGAYLLALLSLRASLTFNVIGYRYLTPVIPLLWLAAASGLAWLADRMRFAGAVARALAIGLLALSAVALVRFVVRLPSPSPERVARRAELTELRALLADAGGAVLSDAGHRVRSATGRDAVEVPPAPFAAREFTAADEQRWRAAGVTEAVFRSGSWRGADPARVRAGLTARFGPHLATRLMPGSPGRWTVVDSSATFVRFALVAPPATPPAAPPELARPATPAPPPARRAPHTHRRRR